MAASRQVNGVESVSPRRTVEEIFEKERWKACGVQRIGRKNRQQAQILIVAFERD